MDSLPHLDEQIALDALTRQERQHFDAHLQNCPRCHAQMVEPLTPSAKTKCQLFTRVDADLVTSARIRARLFKFLVLVFFLFVLTGLIIHLNFP